MALHHYGVLKVTTWALGVIAVAAIALDPTVKVALIVSIPPTITGILAFVLGLMNRKQLQTIKVDVNTNFQKLLQDKISQDKVITEQTQKLAHAEGRREGVESKDAK
jgi:uncharacterized membrane protein (Fun14 family)